MRLLVCCVLALTFTLSLQPAAAQQDQYADMEATMAAAQAQAIHPDDDGLSCDQLQTEMVVTMQDPVVQAQFAQQGAWAQGQVSQMNAARGQIAAQMGASMFLGLASAFLPGLGYVQMAQQRAMAAGQQAQAQQNMAQMMENAQGMMTIMPQMMRGQRVYELGQAKQCPFTQEPAEQE